MPLITPVRPRVQPDGSPILRDRQVPEQINGV